MGERSKHTSMLPDLHSLLNYSSIPYQNLSWNLPRNPALIAHKITSQQSPNSPPASSVVAPNTHSNPRKQNHVSMPVGLFRCASHVAAVIVAAPIERVWILMQCQNEMIKYGRLSSPYKGMKDCFMRTIKNEGFLSLWRGSSISVIGSLTAFLTREVVFPITPRFWQLPLWMLNCQFLYPLYYARVRLANDVKAAQKFYFSLDSTKSSFSNDGVGSRKFSGASDVLYKTLKSEGIVGLCRGFLPACLGVFGSYLCGEWEKKTGKIFIIPAFMTVIGIPVLRYPLVTATLSSEMADRCEHTSMFPDLHWLHWFALVVPLKLKIY
ncbi:ADP,ATP carrier protein, mitochondrial-like [Chenopodium quinoa]|uniref:ADP,ATP carrier protein, mitochondrial-like n=1 Tax=Chenopodium quinoa TaxID=63459 RepID=UPI000B799112|nr:ADP,ATP carrier protein, mitochondrial-like [Chenopodium quinoa]